PPAPTTLGQPTDGLLLGEGFTADSQFALYAGNLDADYDGTIWAQPVAGGAAQQLAALGCCWSIAGGARVVLTDNLKESTTPGGFADGVGDLELIDLAAGGTPT